MVYRSRGKKALQDQERTGGTQIVELRPTLGKGAQKVRRTVLLLVVGSLMIGLAAGAALAVLRVGNDNPNTLRGTFGDNEGQDTLLGFGAGDVLVGRSAADQLAGGFGADRLEGNRGNDTLDGGRGRDRILTGSGFDFVFAADGVRDVINCNGERNYRIIFDANLDRFERCPGVSTASTSDARAGDGRTKVLLVTESKATETVALD
jgi:RTX calcium-binding nonapeptide repeat (4 copies)